MCHVRRCLIFLSDYSKQDAKTTAEHIKHIIELFQNKTVFFSDMSTVFTLEYDRTI